MKKKIVLFVLFVLPLVAYLFFASGVNSFVKLPTLTKSIPDVNPNWQSLNHKSVTLNNKITILGFTGTDVLSKRGFYFLLNQKIYKKYHEFKDFQIVFIAPKGTENQVKDVMGRLEKLSNTSGYKVVFANPDEIKYYFKEMKLLGKLNDDLGTNTVYIVDKKRNLRGRKGKSKKGEEEYKEGYDISSSAELHNNMMDDVKIILAEYRLALKKNNADRKKYGL